MKADPILCLAFLVALLCQASCGAVYPEFATPLRPVPEGARLDPGPPEDLLFIRFVKASIPRRTRDGRQWSGGAPDPYAVLKLDGRELLRTPVAKSTHEPTWPDAPRGNYWVPRGSKAVIELWDEGRLQRYPICTEEVEDLHLAALSDSLEVVCDIGARITLEVRPAKARLGLGLWYEIRAQEVVISKVLGESPASRAGLRPGQRIVSIQGNRVAGLDEGEVRSLINANRRTGLILTVLEPGGESRTAEIKEGPIYPLPGENVPLD